MKTPKFAIKTFGCKVNQYEEQVIRENLLQFGYRESGPREADLFIINSCTVTGEADRKARQLIRRAKKENPGIKIFLTGCYAVFEDDIRTLRSLPEVDAVIPLSDKNRLPLMIDSFFGGKENGKRVKEEISGFSAHTRAFLKMQDGCDQECAYCKVSLVRGPSRCRDERDILDEVVRLTRRGYKEIVLTGICLGAWRGNKGRSLPDLLKEIDRIEEDFRIRLSSLEPNLIDDRLIEAISSSKKVCRHLHIPLQSGSDRILRSMNRRYTTAQFRDLMGRVRKAMPLAGLSMDIIAGFPGERETDHDSTLRFVREVKPSRLHVFKYSDRKGTCAFRMGGKVPSIIARSRVEGLIKEGKALQVEFCGNFLGRKVDVLVEKRSKGIFMEGYTGEYLRARVEGSGGSVGGIVTMKVDGVDGKTASLVVVKQINCQKKGHKARVSQV
jgi:threonylcarbamoyladenosine tRNA methylthiotransferase MtaB